MTATAIDRQSSPERVWRNARLATLAHGARGIGLVTQGALLIRGERIVFAGPERELPPASGARDEIDCEGRWITPGLVDCHTHLIHAGNRAREFELRLRGATYQEIAAAGGGIISTLRATRAATKEQLVADALRRLDAAIDEGVTAIEIKSGYGLDLETERRMLQAARELGRLRKVHVHTTFLGAHAVPPEMSGDADAYIDSVVGTMLPALAADGLIDSVDGFCEHIAFSPAQMSRVFEAAAKHGLRVRLHADQLSNLGGARLAAEHAALSADHLEYSDEASVEALARAATVAVLLPGAFYFLRETTLPPVALLRRHGVPIAVATDCNPGTSPLTSLLLAMNMAATQFRLTVEECLIGTTRAAARALGLESEIGTLEAGKLADFAVWDIDAPAELVYRIGSNPLHSRFWRGR
ncbi:imidazolonepropionase [Steroidobacter agaridevorans]|uniref:Imidazolonepropionase n=1 Tax=Steroidobacter agaridevorans TaxID=2695856 RepID=A0A829YHJ4_9GAMM|nr:imidazolonepropionase [Steroidobacter agaridevorans]GFE82252.1 imidazolonepropionase [Steroidobacter agaridevorans]GFE85360.1 imidazolonepropionase [Steroidobacter agaridevorans]